MKAVILADTSGPQMGNTLRVLRRHGITDAGVVIGPTAKAVQDHFGDGRRFGATLSYFDGTRSLGTAGGVKRAGDFLDEEDFLVIGAEAPEDADLDGAIEYHYRKRSWATLVARRARSRSELGAILTDGDGRVRRLPTGDAADVGICVLKRTVLTYIQEGETLDLGKQVLPLLLRDHRPVFAFDAPPLAYIIA